MGPRNKKKNIRAQKLFTSAPPTKLIKPKFKHKRRATRPWTFEATSRPAPRPTTADVASAICSARATSATALRQERASRKEDRELFRSPTPDSMSSDNEEDKSSHGEAPSIAQFSEMPPTFDSLDEVEAPDSEVLMYRGARIDTADCSAMDKVPLLLSIHEISGAYADELIPREFIPKDDIGDCKPELKWNSRTIRGLGRLLVFCKQKEIEQAIALEVLEETVLMRHRNHGAPKQVGPQVFKGVYMRLEERYE